MTGVGATTGCVVVGTDVVGCCVPGVIVGTVRCGTIAGTGCCGETGAGVVIAGRGAVCCCVATGVAFVLGLTVRGRVAPLCVCACASAGASTSKKNPTLLGFITTATFLRGNAFVGESFHKIRA